MLTQIGDSLIDAYKNDNTKVIILKSEGKVFSAGHDLRELVWDTLNFQSFFVQSFQLWEYTHTLDTS